MEDKRPDQALLESLKARLPELESLFVEASGHWRYEDGVYRLYHQSFKVYYLQEWTGKIVETLRSLMPGTEPCRMMAEIFAAGTGKAWEPEHNGRWGQETRPIVEAFMHARFLLEMACKYGRELESAPRMVPSGWAALLYFFSLR